MLTKQVLKQTIDKLPSSFTIDELLDKLIFIEKVNEGLQQSEQGKTVSKKEAEKKLSKWLK
jgi:predicted transcriptional regulator